MALMHIPRSAARQVGQRPGVHLLLLATLTLGIGVNAAMLALADAVLFRPVPIERTEGLVRVFTRGAGAGELSNGSAPWIDALRAERGVFDGVAGYVDWGVAHVQAEGSGQQRSTLGVAEGDFFRVLGLQAQHGRLFDAGDDVQVGQHAVVVLGDRYWRERFSADPAVLGRVLRINRAPFTVIGVLPPRFESPALGTRTDLWVPLAMAPSVLSGSVRPDFRDNAGFSWLDVVARLAPGVALAAAQQRIDAGLGPDAAQPRHGASPEGAIAFPGAQLLDLRAAAIDPYGSEQHARNAWLLLGVSALVLVIACINAAGLLAVRGEQRLREVGVRIGLGAAPRQEVQRLLLEALLFAGVAALLGWLLAWALVDAVTGLSPDWLVLSGADATDVLLQPRILIAMALCAALAMLAAALLPAMRAARVDVAQALRGGQAATADRGRQRLHALLVAGQVALTLVLLTGAGLLARTLWNSAQVQVGYRSEGVALAAVSVARDGLDAGGYAALYARVRERVEALPGVQAFAWMRSVPVQPGGMRNTIETGVPGAPTGVDANVDLNVVSPRAFDLLGVRLLQGRDFTSADAADAAPVVVVNEAFAARWLPGREALGQGLPGFGERTAQIIGVVANHKQRSVREPDLPQVYVPMAQFPLGAMTMLVRHPQPEALLGQVPPAVAEVDPELPVFRLTTLDRQLAESYAESRALAWLVGGFALLAALLAVVGVYGLLDQWLRAREREFGIRFALGASGARMAGLIAREGAWLLAAGMLTGGAFALLAAQALRGLLFGIEPLDPLNLASACLVLLLLATFAAWPTLRRAAQIAPAAALRQD